MSATLSKDRFPLCSFSVADGRRCRNPCLPAHPHVRGFRDPPQPRDSAHMITSNSLTARP